MWCGILEKMKTNKGPGETQHRARAPRQKQSADRKHLGPPATPGPISRPPHQKARETTEQKNKRKRGARKRKERKGMELVKNEPEYESLKTISKRLDNKVKRLREIYLETKPDINCMENPFIQVEYVDGTGETLAIHKRLDGFCVEGNVL